MVRDVDLTAEALPFWERRWWYVHAALRWPRLFRRAMNAAGRWTAAREEALANVLAVATMAHALTDRSAAEYGLLVFRRG